MNDCIKFKLPFHTSIRWTILLFWNILSNQISHQLDVLMSMCTKKEVTTQLAPQALTYAKHCKKSTNSLQKNIETRHGSTWRYDIASGATWTIPPDLRCLAKHWPPHLGQGRRQPPLCRSQTQTVTRCQVPTDRLAAATNPCRGLRVSCEGSRWVALTTSKKILQQKNRNGRKGNGDPGRGLQLLW